MLNIRKIVVALFVTAMTVMAMSLVCVAAESDGYYIPNLPVWDGTVAEAFAGGDGTKDNPYLISDGSQLALLAKRINDTVDDSDQTTEGEYYKLTNDIVLNDISDFDAWESTPPANKWTPGGGVVNYHIKGFAGYFDGNNYDVWGLYVNTNSGYNGLFGYVYNGQIKNLGLKYAYVSGKQTTAGLAGYVRAQSRAVYISGCDIENSVIYGSTTVGGLIGYVESYSKSSVYLEKCANKSTSVNAKLNYAGGVVASVNAYGVVYKNDGKYAVEINNCTNNGTVVSKGKAAGGIFGSSKDFVTDMNGTTKIALLVKDCVNYGTVSASPYCGGIGGAIGPIDRADTGVVTDIINCHSENSTKIYGHSLSTTDASTSKLSALADMLKPDFLEKNGVKAIKLLGDSMTRGFVTAQDVIETLTAFTNGEGVDDFNLGNIDFDSDGDYDLADINAFVDYLKNKGASGNRSAKNIWFVTNFMRAKNDNGDIEYYVDVFKPFTQGFDSNVNASKEYSYGDIVSANGEDIDSDSLIFGNIYEKGMFLDPSNPENRESGYMEIESFNKETGVLKLKGASAEFIVNEDSVISFSDKSMGKNNTMTLDSSYLATTNKVYYENDDRTVPLRVFVCAHKTADGVYGVDFAIIVRNK